jgi:hypothetical protein
MLTAAVGIRAVTGAPVSADDVGGARRARRYFPSVAVDPVDAVVLLASEGDAAGYAGGLVRWVRYSLVSQGPYLLGSGLGVSHHRRGHLYYQQPYYRTYVGVCH